MYNTKDDILGELSEETLIQLTDDDNLGVVDDVKVAQALTASAAMIDGYCGKLYQVPFAVCPDFIKALDLDITVYNLFSRRENVPENRKTRRDNAVKNLEQIAKGLVTLGIATIPQPAKNTGSASFSSNARLCTRDTMKGL